MVEALEPLGRHGDALEARAVPSAQHWGLNLHNLPAGRVGVGSFATLAWGKGWPGMPSGLTVAADSPAALGASAEPPGEPGHHGHPQSTYLTTTPELRPLVLSDHAGGWG